MKKLISLVLILCLCLSLGIPAAAASTEKADITYRGIRLVLDGEQLIPCDESGGIVEPFIMDGSTYLPLRALAQALGLGVEWNGADSTVSLSSGGEVKTGSGDYTPASGTRKADITYRGIRVFLDGAELSLADANGQRVEPFIMDGSTYLPLRSIGEALELKVDWDAAASTVSLLSEGVEVRRVTETLAMDKAGEMLLSTREILTVSRPDSIRTTVYEGGGAKTESIQYLDSEGQPLSAEHYDARGELCATELWEREGDYLHYTRDDLRDDSADCYIRYFYRDGRLHSAREYGGSTISKVHSTDHEYDYDEAGRLIRHYIHSPDASWEEILYSYDGEGKLLRMEGEAYDIHTNGFGRYYIQYYYEGGILVRSESTGGCMSEYFYGDDGRLVRTVAEKTDGSFLISQYK